MAGDVDLSLGLRADENRVEHSTVEKNTLPNLKTMINLSSGKQSVQSPPILSSGRLVHNTTLPLPSEALPAQDAVLLLLLYHYH